MPAGARRLVAHRPRRPAMWIESDDDYRPVPGEWIVAKLAELQAALTARDPDFRSRRPREFLDPNPFYASVARGAPEHGSG